MNFIPKKECVYLTPADDQAMIDLASGTPNVGTRFLTLAVGDGCDADVCEAGRIVYLASFDVRHVTQFADGWIVHHSAILAAEEYEEVTLPEDRPTATEMAADLAPPPPRAAPVAAPALAPLPPPRPAVRVSRPVAAAPPAVSRPVQPAAAPVAPVAPVVGYPSAAAPVAPVGPAPGPPTGQQADTGVTTTVTAGPDAKPRTATPPRRAPGTPRRAPQPPRQ